MAEHENEATAQSPPTAVAAFAGKVAFSVNEFCQAFGVKRGLVYDEIKAGRLKARKAGSRTLIRAVDARLWLDGMSEPSAGGGIPEAGKLVSITTPPDQTNAEVAFEIAPAAQSLYPYWPAALRLDQAAAYCGLSPATFLKVCPTKPIAFTSSSRGNRYLRQRLDEWLLSLDPNPKAVQRRFGERINARD